MPESVRLASTWLDGLRVAALSLTTACWVACGSGPTTPSPTATITITSFAATTDRSDTGLAYHFSLHLVEATGRTGVTITQFTFSLQPTNDVLASGLPVHIAAGASVDTPTLHFSYLPSHPTAAQVTVTIAYLDDQGHQGTATTLTPITPVQRFAVSGTLTDSLSGVPLSAARIGVIDTAGGSPSIATDRNGHYTLPNVASGKITLVAVKDAYDGASADAIVSGDMTVDIRLDAMVEFRVAGTAHVLVSTQLGSLIFVDVPSQPNFSFVYGVVPHAGDRLALSAKIDRLNDPGTVTVTLYKHGQLYQTASATGYPAVASVEGTF